MFEPSADIYDNLSSNAGSANSSQRAPSRSPSPRAAHASIAPPTSSLHTKEDSDTPTPTTSPAPAFSLGDLSSASSFRSSTPDVISIVKRWKSRIPASVRRTRAPSPFQTSPTLPRDTSSRVGTPTFQLDEPPIDMIAIAPDVYQPKPSGLAVPFASPLLSDYDYATMSSGAGSASSLPTSDDDRTNKRVIDATAPTKLSSCFNALGVDQLDVPSPVFPRKRSSRRRASVKGSSFKRGSNKRRSYIHALKTPPHHPIIFDRESFKRASGRQAPSPGSVISKLNTNVPTPASSQATSFFSTASASSIVVFSLSGQSSGTSRTELRSSYKRAMAIENRKRSISAPEPVSPEVLAGKRPSAPTSSPLSPRLRTLSLGESTDNDDVLNRSAEIELLDASKLRPKRPNRRRRKVKSIVSQMHAMQQQGSCKLSFFTRLSFRTLSTHMFVSVHRHKRFGLPS